METIQKKKGVQKYDHITNNGIFCFLWMNVDCTEAHKKFLYGDMSIIRKIY